jgi:hypothetical protein
MTSHARPLPRVRLSLGFAIALFAVPTARVAACSCAFSEMPQAIRDADLAFVGTLVATDAAVPAPGNPAMDEIEWTWNVERARQPITASRALLQAWPDNGGNCGVAFGIDERWLVLGHLEDGRMVTNGCMRNHRMDGSDPDTEAIIAEMVSVRVTPGSPTSAGSPPAVPAPLLVAITAAAFVVVASVWAFRRAR